MIIGGLQKFSLLDFPGQLAAVVFTQGCNFRCQFCYNPMLVRPASANRQEVAGKLNNITSLAEDEVVEKGLPQISEDDLFDFLSMRQGKLEAVVLSGGEPTIHDDLPEFMIKIKQLGYKIKLDTNGTNPIMLKKIIRGKLVDYLAMDIKAPTGKYAFITGSEPNLRDIKESVRVVKASKLPYEFRTTVVPGLLVLEDIARIGKIIMGADRWYLQRFKSNTTLLNPALRETKPYTDRQMARMRKMGAEFVKKCEIR